MTGARPTRSRFLNYYTHVDQDLPGHLSIPRHLKESGYYTLSYGKVYHHNDDDPDGWSEQPWRPSGKTWRNYITELNLKLEDSLEDGRAMPYENAPGAEDSDYFDGQIADTAISRLKGLKEQGKPFLLSVGFLKPHLPFNAPSKYWDLYDPESLELADNPYKPKNAPDEAMHNWGELRFYLDIPETGPVSKEMERNLVHGYYACVSYIDAMVGKLLDELDRLDLAKNTVVILFGDHGWNLGEHGLWCKHCNFDNAMRTPLIVRGPGVTSGGKASAITEFVDIYPSICDLANLSKPDHLEGKSFISVLNDPSAEHRTHGFSRYQRGESIITSQYVYTEWYQDDQDVERPRMLYDHHSDLDENVNISEEAENEKIVEELSLKLRSLTDQSIE